MVGWHHQLNGHEFEQAPGDGEGQGSLACCSPSGRKELDSTEGQNNSNSPNQQRRTEKSHEHRDEAEKANACQTAFSKLGIEVNFINLIKNFYHKTSKKLQSASASRPSAVHLRRERAHAALVAPAKVRQGQKHQEGQDDTSRPLGTRL